MLAVTWPAAPTACRSSSQETGTAQERREAALKKKQDDDRNQSASAKVDLERKVRSSSSSSPAHRLLPATRSDPLIAVGC